MHELSLAAEILRLVQDAAARERFRHVATLRLEAGALAGVEVPALRFALDAIAAGTCLEGARIDIEQPAGRAWCAGCADEVAVGSRTDACPRCGGLALRPTGGDALRVLDLMVRAD
jgi:hydrogenase nickel incorporation protein HypA/HybF